MIYVEHQRNRNGNETMEKESNFSRCQKRKQQPTIKELASFESKLIELVKNIKLRQVKNQLPNQ